MSGASDLAAALRRNTLGAARANPGVKGADFHLATVSAVGSDGTVTTTDGIIARRMETYLAPVVGDLIVVTVSGKGSWLALGRTAPSDAGTAWVSYTPTFVSAGGGAAAGNALVDAKYTLRGDECTVRLSFVAGTTTTFGTGTLRWGLPFTSAALPSASMFWAGSAMCSDAGTAYYPGMCRVIGGTSYLVGISAVTAAGSAATEWRFATPFTWASTDYASFGVTYQIA
ncbi:hypothetical protein [Streptomyces filamentosus]|uniref:Uncharacterized protein n=1 Tax=Streptomyces filamentosus TaxID=67294 RepID=A0A919BPR4_STRFL|nr:hypothetical protein [Streptomyces filamentosus]GHG02591.1 hypothetical protein GCM10017667_37990 [Streptomyces filamentosus]